MLEWILEKKAENTGVEMDDVWELQKKFDEFQRVSKRTLFKRFIYLFFGGVCIIFVRYPPWCLRPRQLILSLIVNN